MVGLVLFGTPSQLSYTQETSETESPKSSETQNTEASLEPEAASREQDQTAKLSPYSTADEEESIGGKGFDEKVSLDLRNIEVTEAIRYLATKGKLNLAVSKNVQGRLMLLLEQVPIRDVFDIILRTNELAYDKQGDIYNIMTEAEYKARYGRSFSDARMVKIFQLTYAIPSQVFSVIDQIKSEIGRVLVDAESGVALVIDTKESLAKIEEVVSALEQRREVRIFNLQYAKATDIEERLKTQLDTKTVGTVVADERSNQLIVQTLSDRMGEIAKLVESLDQKTKEVLIVSKIVKISLSDTLNADIQWEGLLNHFNNKKNTERFIGNHPVNALARTGESFIDDFVVIAPTTRPTAGAKRFFTENFVFGMRDTAKGGDRMEFLLNFLKTLGDTRILSSPRLLIVNNQEAKLHVGERQVYVTTTTTTGTSTTTTAEQVNFIDIGIKLGITPTINDDGFITMKIKPEVSSVTGTLVTPTGNRIPIVDTSEAETTVMVRDGTTVIIAGLRRLDKTKTEEAVPFLSDIPVLGRLFRSSVDRKQRSELLVLLTPHLIGGDRFETGENPPAAFGLKNYEDYPALQVKSEKKPDSSGSVWDVMKKAVLLGHD